MGTRRRRREAQGLTLELVNQFALGVGPFPERELRSAWERLGGQVALVGGPLWAALRFDEGASAKDATRAVLGAEPLSYAASWIERFVVHGDGDYFGQPYVLRGWERELLANAYATANGTRRYRRVLWGLAKGAGKTSRSAAVGLFELAGPAAITLRGPRLRVSPDICVAAASYDQANLLFGTARLMVEAGPLAGFLKCYEGEIVRADGVPAKLYKVAAEAGTNEGRRPTCAIFDELHEWTGNLERVYGVLTNNTAKRAETWTLAISTAGWDSQSLLGRLKAEAERGEDPRFLMAWFEAPAGLDLDDPVQLEQGIRAANPGVGDFVPLANVVQMRREKSEPEFRRFFLNQFTATPEHWLPPGAMEARTVRRTIPPGTEICLGFDGSLARDSTALVGCTLEPVPHLFVIDAWEKPPTSGPEWRVPVLEVEDKIRWACRRWKIVRAGFDPAFWQRSLEVLADEGLPVEAFTSHNPTLMVPACGQFYDAVTNGGLTHDGDPRLLRHTANCIVKTDARGQRISKDHKDSTRHIDLTVAAVIALYLVLLARAAAEASGWDFAHFSLPGLAGMDGTLRPLPRDGFMPAP
jgi:phage terminase large subunit-like protein